MTIGAQSSGALRHISACIALLRDAGVPIKRPPPERAALEFGTSIGDCLASIRGADVRPIVPIRTLHHLACTGGTLFAKCLSALPNVRLLSEVDPLSDLMFDAERPAFAPTDLVTLLKQTPGGRDEELIVSLFRSQIEVLHANAARFGRHLVIRDHSHSHFCVGASLRERPRLVDLLPAGVPVRSLITVRHPVDSFASLQQNGWVSFAPADFETYCTRYHAFLDAHRGIPIIRYEDFVADPIRTMRRIAAVLELPANDDFADMFGVFKVTGDSGRSGDVIAPRERHAAAAGLAKRYHGVPIYDTLLGRLDYEPDHAG
jgi:hypothetical protein